MSRYVCHFLVNLSPVNVRFPLKKLFEACGMETIYEIDDYLMAREIPGQVKFSRLVTAEVLIDITDATQSSVKLSFVVKNEELPLIANNHCRQVFDLLRVAISHNYDWESISNFRTTAASSTAQLERNLSPTPDHPVAEIEATEIITIESNLTTAVGELSTSFN
jgi:hypothetical protein